MHDLRRTTAPLSLAAPFALATALVIALATTFGTYPAAQASSAAAWAELEQDAAAACAAASDLKDPVVHPSTARFDDTTGIDARLVSGAWKPAHMKGAKTVMLCLYDRKTRRASTQEAVAWRDAFAVPATRPAAPAPAKKPVKP
jgi:hypothetical protein